LTVVPIVAVLAMRLFGSRRQRMTSGRSPGSRSLRPLVGLALRLIEHGRTRLVQLALIGAFAGSSRLC
jgi:hypothetical protein